MDFGTPDRQNVEAHKGYLDTLQRPSPAEMARIQEIQIRKEHDISAKYHSKEEHEAAKLIQRAYRGHRERRQLTGLSVDPSSRWDDFIKQWKYLSATAPHVSQPAIHRDRSDSAAHARLNWQRVAAIAEFAVAGETREPQDTAASPSHTPSHSIFKGRARSDTGSDPSDSMLMDLRYFLEMVDQKHRYGANLQIYHEEWQRNNTDQNFFYWLDHGKGRHEDLTPVCPRAKLEKERIRYLTKEERRDYLVRVDHDGLLRWEKNDELITTDAALYRDSITGIVAKDSTEPAYDDEDVKRQRSANDSFTEKIGTLGGMFRDTVSGDHGSGDGETSSRSSSVSSRSSANLTAPTKYERQIAHQSGTKDHTPGEPKLDAVTKEKRKHIHVSPAVILNHLLRAAVRPGTWIYVADTVGRLYVGLKASGAFQHASFLSGARIRSAGIIGIAQGRLEYLSPLSGHYRPTTKSFRVFVEDLKAQGVDTRRLKISSAYKVLLGMEYYGKGKNTFQRILHHEHDDKKRGHGDEVSVAEDLHLAHHHSLTGHLHAMRLTHGDREKST